MIRLLRAHIVCFHDAPHAQNSVNDENILSWFWCQLLFSLRLTQGDLQFGVALPVSFDKRNSDLGIYNQVILKLDWHQSLKQFFIKVSYHILVASLTLMALKTEPSELDSLQVYDMTPWWKIVLRTGASLCSNPICQLHWTAKILKIWDVTASMAIFYQTMLLFTRHVWSFFMLWLSFC